MGWMEQRGLWLAFAAGVVCVGLSFWFVPYNRLNVPDGLYGPGLAVVFVLALLLCVTGTATLVRAATVMSASVPAAVLLRVIVEGAMHPTRHNLWPLVLVIALVVGAAVAVPGAAIGRIVRGVTGNDRRARR